MRASSQQRGRCGPSSLEWPVTGIKGNNVGYLWILPEPWNSSCSTGLHSRRMLARSLSVRSSGPCHLHPDLSQTRAAHCPSRAPHSSPCPPNSEGPSGHLKTGQSRWHFWSPACVGCRAWHRLWYRGGGTPVSPPQTAEQQAHRRPWETCLFLFPLFRVNTFGVDSLDSLAFPLSLESPAAFISAVSFINVFSAVRGDPA